MNSEMHPSPRDRCVGHFANLFIASKIANEQGNPPGVMVSMAYRDAKRRWLTCMEARKAIFIGRSMSHCGACGRDADPMQRGHFTLLGYGTDNGKPGCGVIWEYVGSEYRGGGIPEAAREMRPDLEWTEAVSW